MRRLIKVGLLCGGFVAVAAVPSVEARVGVAAPALRPVVAAPHPIAPAPHPSGVSAAGPRGPVGRGMPPRPGFVDAQRGGRFGGYGRFGTYGRYGRYGAYNRYGAYGGYGGYGYGDYGVGLGLDALDGALVQPADTGGYGPGLDAGPGPLPPPGVIPGPCLPPRMLKVGRGLAHPPKVRVVYGVPACSTP